MKFSVLLPTRNRLDLLRYAVETVLRQDYADWEIIISDNDSEQDVAGYVQSLHEPRIKYFRTGSFIPVTDNWNNALEKSTGNFMVMLGDDDGLMQGCFSTLRGLVERYGPPDFIYTNALLYAYPGVIPTYPEGYLQPIGYAEFLRTTTTPFWLDKSTALRQVRQAMNFRMSYGYNMQYAVISRGLIDRLKEKGEFFQSPYPDFYAMNLMMLKAERILICPFPLVTIGISPKSFGYYYFNRQEREGTEFLKNLPKPELARSLEQVILPGTDMNTSWLLAMETIRLNCGAEEESLRVNYRRYRLLQMIRVYSWLAMEPDSAKVLHRQLWGKLKIGERCLGACFWLMAKMLSVLPRARRQQAVNLLFVLTGIGMSFFPKKIVGRYRNIVEVFERIDPLASCSAPVERG